VPCPNVFGSMSRLDHLPPSQSGDTGPGLSQAGAERMFDAFYTTKLGGLSMALAICRSVVEARGGRLWLTPNEPRGAILSIMLPIGEKLIESHGPPDV
jgi:signal transduction histidine kinase